MSLCGVHMQLTCGAFHACDSSTLRKYITMHGSKDPASNLNIPSRFYYGFRLSRKSSDPRGLTTKHRQRRCL